MIELFITEDEAKMLRHLCLMTIPNEINVMRDYDPRRNLRNRLSQELKKELEAVKHEF